MRNPRPQDFDPDFRKSLSPKPEKVDMSGVVAIKPKPMPSLSEPQITVPSERGELSVRNVRSVPPLQKRETKRHAFDIYKDQLESLIELKLKTMKQGNLKSMSAMVREALDNFIKNY